MPLASLVLRPVPPRAGSPALARTPSPPRRADGGGKARARHREGRRYISAARAHGRAGGVARRAGPIPGRCPEDLLGPEGRGALPRKPPVGRGRRAPADEMAWQPDDARADARRRAHGRLSRGDLVRPAHGTDRRGAPCGDACPRVAGLRRLISRHKTRAPAVLAIENRLPASVGYRWSPTRGGQAWQIL